MRLTVLAALSLALAASANAKTFSIKAGPSAEADAAAAFAQAQSGDAIRFGEGRFALSHGLRIKAGEIEIRGKGPERTILTFTDMAGEGDGLTVEGDRIAVRGLSIVDAKGAGLAVSGRAAAIESVAVRGALGPGVLLSNVQGAIVQRSSAQGALDGFEVRNSGRVDLIDNEASNNGVGVLIDDRPGAPAGGPVRLVHNRISGNAGQGVGVDIVAVKDVAILQNEIGEHGTANVFIRAFPGEIADPAFDALPRNITVRANKFAHAGFAPAHDWAPAAANGAHFADIVWDGARSYVAAGAPHTEPVWLAIEGNTSADGAPSFLSLGLEAAGAPAAEANPSNAWPPVAHFAAPEPVKLK